MGEKSIQKKQYILKKAREVFVKRGYKDVTMKDIVEACEISRGGLYLYFESTRDIFLAVLKKDINDFELRTNSEEIGTVIRVGDGIATIHGLDHAMYGEIVVFENGVKGMVQDIKRHQIGVILFDSDTGVEQGTKVKRTHKKAGVPVGDGFSGNFSLGG